MPVDCGAARRSASLETLHGASSHLLLLIFLHLRADERLRCAAVCKTWRALVKCPLLWRTINLSAVQTACDALLSAATANSAGGLRTLDVTGCSAISHVALLRAVQANATSLCTLRACRGLNGAHYSSVEEIEALVSSAPLLQRLEVDACCSAGDARRLLRGEIAPAGREDFKFIAVRHLIVEFDFEAATAADVKELAADVAKCDTLTKLAVVRAPLAHPAALKSLIDAALARRLSTLCLGDCNLGFSAVPTLARLLRSRTALTNLTVHNSGRQLFNARGAALFARALRASASLTSLSMMAVDLWRCPAAASVLIDASKGLNRLIVAGNVVPAAAQDASGRALGKLLDVSALSEEIDVSDCALADAGLAALVNALPRNRTLRVLRCANNRMTTDFALLRLLPAVRANASLCMIMLEHGVPVSVGRAR